jgi:hypothetical protein
VEKPKAYGISHSFFNFRLTSLEKYSKCDCGICEKFTETGEAEIKKQT